MASTCQSGNIDVLTQSNAVWGLDGAANLVRPLNHTLRLLMLSGENVPLNQGPSRGHVFGDLHVEATSSGSTDVSIGRYLLGAEDTDGYNVGRWSLSPASLA